MWMEAGGGWNGTHQEEVEAEWDEIEEAVGKRFPGKWRHLLGAAPGRALPATSPRGGGGGGGARRGGARSSSTGGGGGGGALSRAASGGIPSRATSGSLPSAASLPVAVAAGGYPQLLAQPGAGAAVVAAAAAAAADANPVIAELMRAMAEGAAGGATLAPGLLGTGMDPGALAAAMAAAAAAAAGTTAAAPTAAFGAAAAALQGQGPLAAPGLSLRPRVRPRKWGSMQALALGISPPCITHAAAPSEHEQPPLPARGEPYMGPRPKPPPASAAGSRGGRGSSAGGAAGVKRESEAGADDGDDTARGSKRVRGDAAAPPTPLAAALPALAPPPVALPAGTAPEVAAMFNLMLECGRSWGPAGTDARDLSQALAAALGSSCTIASAGNGTPAGAAAAPAASAPAAAAANGHAQPAAVASSSGGGGGAALPRAQLYTGCVDAPPPLQPGEARALGVTAHPDLLARVGRAPAGAAAAAGTGAPAVVVPAATAARLQVDFGLSTEALTAQLQQLIEEAAACWEGCAGGSGGGGLPPDVPTRFVEACNVTDSDPRVGLRGERALRATEVIRAPSSRARLMGRGPSSPRQAQCQAGRATQGGHAAGRLPLPH
jgi:hypothetical protein